MSETEFDRKANVVASAWGELEGNPDWHAILEHFNLGFPFAHLHNTKMGTLKAEGKRQVTNTYDFLLQTLGLEDDERYWSFWDLLNAHNERA